MLLGIFYLATTDLLWTGVFFVSSALLLGMLGFAIIRNRKQKGINTERNSIPLFTSVPEFNEAIDFTGFQYEESQDIFYSMLNPWQREFGYCRFYDEAAAALSMIVDAEPIYFEYNGKDWLIEFWKGQYGMTTGGEVGIYNTDSSDYSLLDWNGKLFQSASDDELLDITTTLYKNNRPLFTRHDLHWWLTGFVLGEFSEPDELSMIIRINFRDYEMRDAFLKGLTKAGYRPNEYRVKRLNVSIHFGAPHTAQPITRTKLTDSLTQLKNKELCEIYRKATEQYPTIIDKMNALRREDEALFEQALQFGRQKELFHSLNKIKGEKETTDVSSQQT